jgi:hypothetical protein
VATVGPPEASGTGFDVANNVDEIDPVHLDDKVCMIWHEAIEMEIGRHCHTTIADQASDILGEREISEYGLASFDGEGDVPGAARFGVGSSREPDAFALRPGLIVGH